jgi:hypothetical protein
MSGSLGFGAVNPQYLQMLAMQQAAQGPQGVQGGPQPSLTGQPINYQGPVITPQQPMQLGAGQMPMSGGQGVQPVQAPQSAGQQILAASGGNPLQQLQQSFGANAQNQAQANAQPNANTMSTAALAQHQGANPGMGGLLQSILQKYTGY